jgi:hypothetical protein
VKAPFIPVESELSASLVVTSSERASVADASEEVQAPGLPGAEEPGEKQVQVESGLKPPPILLEGDEATSVTMTGPGQKYALGPAAAGVQVGHEEVALPEAYGTGKLLLAARDPHRLYAHWDLMPSQQRHYNSLSADRHLLVRVFPRTVTGPPEKEIHVHPESRHWFVHVDRADTEYVAELGYYPPGRHWVTVATSAPTVTPGETISTDQAVRFVTVPAQVPLSQLAALATQRTPADRQSMEAREHALAERFGTIPAEAPLSQLAVLAEETRPSDRPSMEAREHAFAERFATIPAHALLGQLAAQDRQTGPTELPPMGATSEQALAELAGLHLVRQDSMSSAEVGEVVRGRDEQEIVAGQIVQPASAGGEAESISSPSGVLEQRPKGFWFNINAELILYGATEQDASVTIGGRPIQLRPDGTFSCRFSLPDGEHAVTVSALSAQGDLRQAELRFGRRTDYSGEVGATPQDQSLVPHGAENP